MSGKPVFSRIQSYSHGKRVLFSCTVILLLLSFFSCKEVWGPLEKPADPDSSSYQGYPTVGSVDEVDVAVISPASGGTLIGTTLTVSNFIGASAYAVGIAASEASLGTTNLHEKSDYTTNVLDIADALITDGTTYHWQSCATKPGTEWGNWTAVAFLTTDFQPFATPSFSPPGGFEPSGLFNDVWSSFLIF